MENTQNTTSPSLAKDLLLILKRDISVLFAQHGRSASRCLLLAGVIMAAMVVVVLLIGTKKWLTDDAEIDVRTGQLILSLLFIGAVMWLGVIKDGMPRVLATAMTVAGAMTFTIMPMFFWQDQAYSHVFVIISHGMAASVIIIQAIILGFHVPHQYSRLSLRERARAMDLAWAESEIRALRERIAVLEAREPRP